MDTKEKVKYTSQYYKKFTPLLDKKPHRLAKIPSIQDLRRYIFECGLKNDSVFLDLGCGSCYLLNYFSHIFSFNFVGMDISPIALRIARQRFYEAKFKLFTGNSLSLSIKSESIDIAFMNHIIEHFDLSDSEKVLSEVRRVLKPNGFLIINTPDKTSLCWRLYKIFRDREETHFHEFEKKEFLQFLLKYFQVIDFTRSNAFSRINGRLVNFFLRLFPGEMIVKCRKN